MPLPAQKKNETDTDSLANAFKDNEGGYVFLGFLNKQIQLTLKIYLKL